MADILSNGPAASMPLSDVAPTIVRGVGRILSDLGFSTLTEVNLATGRRVDVIGVNRQNRIAIVEVKSGPADFRSDRKWHEYLEFCDYFYFAVGEEFPLSLLPEGPGLIVADRFSGAIIRPAPEIPIPASRRRSLTLRFARKAADRLRRLQDPEA